MPRYTRIAATAVLGAVAVAELLTSTQSLAATTHKTTHAPKIVSATVKCVVTDHEDLPGMKNVPLYQPRLTWKVKYATGMALSVDDPHLVGSYGTYGKSGKIFLGGGCYKDDGQTLITFYTVGGHGKRAHKTIVKTGTLNRITAPPLG